MIVILCAVFIGAMCWRSGYAWNYAGGRDRPVSWVYLELSAVVFGILVWQS